MPNKTPTTMRAAVLLKHGGVETTALQSMPVPACQPQELLLKVETAALNHLDLFVCKGWPGLKLSLPHILGSDAAGTIAAIGAEAPRWIAPILERPFAVGDKVIINPGFTCGRCEFCVQGDAALCTELKIVGENFPGTYAEYVTVPAAYVYPLPEHLNVEEGAALPLTFITAWRLLWSRAKITKGETLLIQGIGSGVGTAALQLSVKFGVRVIVTSRSKDKLKRALSLGAEQAFDANDPDLSRQVRELTGKRGVDVVLDSVGVQTWDQSMKSLKRGGRLVTCGATSGPAAVSDVNRMFANQLSLLGSTMGSNVEFQQMYRFVCKHKIRPLVDSTYRLEEYKKALGYLESAQQMGKVVLKIG